MKDSNKKEVEEMDRQIVQVQKIVFSDKCDVCGKEISGTSEGQVEHNLRVHKMTQHSSQNANGKA